jgi:hypothetical protein
MNVDRLKELAGVQPVDEANRIGTALYKNQIPQEYKQYPVIGQGATSVVLEKDPNTVYVLTRDAHKKDWLTHGIGLADWIDTQEIHHPNPRIRDIPVYVLKMPKLLPLDPANKKKIRAEVKFWDGLYTKHVWGKRGSRSIGIQDAMNDYLDQRPEGLFAELFNHLGNYDLDSVSPDLLMRNFMQDSKGNIILIDPVVDMEIVRAFTERPKPSYW